MANESRSGAFGDAAGVPKPEATAPDSSPAEATDDAIPTPASTLRPAGSPLERPNTPAPVKTVTEVKAQKHHRTGSGAHRASTRTAGIAQTPEVDFGTSTDESIRLAEAARRAARNDPRAHMRSPEEIERLVVEHGLSKSWSDPKYARDKEALLGDPTTIFHEGKGVVRRPDLDHPEKGAAFHSLNGAGAGRILYSGEVAHTGPLQRGQLPFNDDANDRDYQRITYADRLSQIQDPRHNHPWAGLVKATYAPAAAAAITTLHQGIRNRNRGYNSDEARYSRENAGTGPIAGSARGPQESDEHYNIRVQKRVHRANVARRLQEFYPDVHPHVLTHALGYIPGDAAKGDDGLEPLPLVGKTQAETGVKGKGLQPLQEYSPDYGNMLLDHMDRAKTAPHKVRQGQGKTLEQRIARIQQSTHGDAHFQLEISPEQKAALQQNAAVNRGEAAASAVRGAGPDNRPGDIQQQESAAQAQETKQRVPAPSTVPEVQETSDENGPTREIVQVPLNEAAPHRKAQDSKHRAQLAAEAVARDKEKAAKEKAAEGSTPPPDGFTALPKK